MRGDDYGKLALKISRKNLVGLVSEIDAPDPHLLDNFSINSGLRQNAAYCHYF
jgi:hypothetical protein